MLNADNIISQGSQELTMVGPIRLEGIVSGFNYTEIINAILRYQKRPITLWQEDIQTIKQKQTAFMTIQAELLGLKAIVELLSKPSFYARTKVTASNPDIIEASGNLVTSLGAFVFRAHKLTQTHQIVSSGFPDKDQTPVATTNSTIKIEFGDAILNTPTPLSSLNAGAGVDRGSIKITQDSSSTILNLEGALTLQDIIETINNNPNLNINATFYNDRLVLVSDAPFQISEYGADTTASDLGIAGNAILIDGKYYLIGNQINKISTSTLLSSLNNQAGVRYSSLADFTIQVIVGGTPYNINIDIDANDKTVGDVINKINTQASNALAGTGAQVTASINADATGINILASSVSGISISWLNNSLSAVDLGFGVVSGSSFYSNDPAKDPLRISDLGNNNYLVLGSRLIPSLNSVMRSSLNGGMTLTNNTQDVKGVRSGIITVTNRAGVTANINLSSRVATTLVADALGGAESITVNSTEGLGIGNKIYIVSSTGTVEAKTITRISGNTVYFDNQPLSNNFTIGAQVIGLNESAQDIINTFNYSAAGINVSMALNQARNGFFIKDTSGGTQNLIIQDTAGSFAAEDLGIKTSATGVASNTLTGRDVDLMYISENTPLSKLNFGSGVAKGKIKIIHATGDFIVDLSQEEDNTIGRVIFEINNATGNPGTVKAYINDTGDGIILTGVKKVEEQGSTTARDLGILKIADENNIINGSFEKTIKINSGAKLVDIANAINSAGLPLSASIINDGSATNPYKLILTSRYPGTAGRIMWETDITGLDFSTLVEPRNSVLILGAENNTEADPLVFTSSSNVYTDIIPGLTLKLNSQSTQPVTVTVEKDIAGVVDQVNKFVERYNSIIDKIKEHGTYNPDTKKAGILYPDSVINSIQRNLSYSVTQIVKEITSGPRGWRDIGVSLTETGKLTFDSSKLESILSTNPSQIEELFTKQRILTLDTLLADFNNGNGVKENVGDDFKIYPRDAKKPIYIDISGVKTVAELLSRINNDPDNNGRIKAAISSDGFHLELWDQTTPATSLTGTKQADNQIQVSLSSDYTKESVEGSTIKIGSQTSKVTNYDPATGIITLASNIVPGAVGDSVSFDIERELKVAPVNNSPAGYDLKIIKQLSLGETTLKSDLINLTGDPGLAFITNSRVDAILDAEFGLIPKRLEGFDKQIKELENSIKNLEDRIKKEEERLTRQFGALEAMISSAQAVMLRLQQFAAGNMAFANLLGRTGGRITSRI